MKQPPDWLKENVFDIFRSLPIGLVGVDLSGKITYVNPRFEEMIGMSVQVGTHIHDVIHTEILPGDLIFRRPLQITTTRHNKKWIEYSLYPFTHNGQQAGYLLTFVPIPAYNLSDSPFEATQAEFRAFFDAGTIGKCVINDNLEIIDANQYMHNVTRCRELVGKSLLDCFPKKNQSELKNIMHDQLVSHHDSTFMFHFNEGESIKYVEFRLSKNFIPGFHAVFITDVTGQELEKKRRDLYLSTVGHELKNPIAVIKAYTQMMLMKLKKTGEDKLVEYLEKIDDKTDLLTKFINDLVDELYINAHRLKLTIEDVAVDEVVQSAIDEARKIDPKHEYVLKGSASTTVKADATRLHQVLSNILSNARKYSPAGTTITLTAKKTREAVQLTITDEGIGISPDEHERIFEPFYRIKIQSEEKIYGLGLGLYLSKQIVAAHQGSITLKSEPGIGTSVTITLPRLQT